ncbi:MAG: hypothetical protein ABIO70_04950 [Pseudomonadota bacterium]
MLRRSDAIPIAILLSLAVLAQLLLRSLLDVDLPIGLDMELWGFATLNASVGGESFMHPLYPVLSSLLMQIAGMTHLDAAVVVSSLAGVLVPPATWGLARLLGATPRTALGAGLAALLFPGVLVFGSLVSADAATTLALIALAAAAAAYARTPDWRRLGLLVAALAVTSILREHGTLCAVLSVPLVLLAPERHHQRVLGLVAIAAGLVLAPLLVGAPPSLPGTAPWAGRLLVPLMDILDEHDATLARFPVGGLDLGPFHTIAFAVTRAPVAWVWVALAYTASLRGDRALRAAMLVGVGPALAGLMVISQPRHVWVTLPICIAAWLAAPRAAGTPRRLVLASSALLLLLAQTRWIPLENEGKQRNTWKDSYSISTEIGRFVHESGQYRRRSAAICALAGPNDLWAGDPDPFLFCPMRQTRVYQEPDAANLHTWYAGERAPCEGWRRVWHPDIHTPVFRFLWMGADRPIPCADSAPAADTPYREMPPQPATMAPPCEADAAFVVAYYAAEKSLDERDRLAAGVESDATRRAARQAGVAPGPE